MMVLFSGKKAQEDNRSNHFSRYNGHLPQVGEFEKRAE